jgi:molecular chaperone Hsp33
VNADAAAPPVLDVVLPFAVPALDVRGRCVKLGPALDAILARHAYPAPVAHLLAEAAALAVLLGTALKFEGRFQLQARTAGIVDLLVVDVETPDSFRAMARFDKNRLAEAEDVSPAALLGQGHLALTVDQGTADSRYQGVVALEGEGLEAAAQQYFRQSEQIPTKIRLAAGQVLDKEGAHIRAGGLLVQFLPSSTDRLRNADLPPGDAPEGSAILGAEGSGEEDDAWREARILTETVEDHELIDPTLPAERLVYRLFHESDPEAFPVMALREACRCSRPRILDMLKGFSAQDRRDMVADDGRIVIACEFCSRSYAFDAAALEAELQGES